MTAMIVFASRLLLLGCLVFWVSSAGGRIDWATLTVLALLIVLAWGVGHLTLRASGLLDAEPRLRTDVPQLSVGIPLLVTGAFVISLLSPLALWLDGLLIAGIVLILLAWSRFRDRCASQHSDPSQSETVAGGKVDAIFLVLALLITTLWCRDLLQPVRLVGELVEVRAWGDVYYHLSQIARMASAQSVWDLQDIQMAGSHAQPYHLAGYLIPALVKNATDQSAWAVYSGLFVPVGLLLTAFASYTLALTLFGRPAAMVAGLALLLLPDAAQMGMGLRFLSYHWLQQVGPAGMYGVAASAMAFMFMCLACNRAKVAWMLPAALLVGCVLLLKAQIFVAITFPLIIMPALFFKGLSIRWRLALLAASTAGFLTMVAIGQMSLSVPLMRLDGSGLAPYSQMLTNMQSRGLLKEWSMHTYPLIKEHWWLGAAAFLPVLVFSTFGLHVLATAWASWVSRGRISSIAAWIPWLVVSIYVAMTMGLALDDRAVGMPEELLHRPFVWAYFVVVTLTAAMIWHHLYGQAWPKKRSARATWLVFGLLLLATPIHFGKRIQTMPSWGRGYETLPACLYHATQFVRDNSRPDAIVQEQKADPTFAVTALTERSAWAVDSGGHRMPTGLSERIRLVQRIENETDFTRATKSLREAGVHMYIASDRDNLAWLHDDSIRSGSVAFECGNVAVIQVRHP